MIDEFTEKLCFVVVQVRSCRIIDCGGVTVMKQGAMVGFKAHTNWRRCYYY